MSLPSKTPRVKEKRKSHVRNKIVKNKYIHFNYMEPKFFFLRETFAMGLHKKKKNPTIQLIGK